MTRRLIVTADDFGDTPAVNAAVVRAYREGILRFASLMVGRPAAAEAARLARENPGLGVGLHLELCADAPEKAGLRYFFNTKARAGLEGEIRRQIEALLTLGVTPTHIDGHINTHIHPIIFPLLCRLAHEYAIPRVRIPSGEWEALKSYPESLSVGTAILAGTFSVMGAWIRPSASGLEVPTTWGLLRSGLMSVDYVLWLLRRLPPGTSELYFHPTTDGSLRAGTAPTASHQSVTELETLLDPRVRAALEEEGIELVEPRGPVRA